MSYKLVLITLFTFSLNCSESLSSYDDLDDEISEIFGASGDKPNKLQNSLKVGEVPNQPVTEIFPVGFDGATVSPESRDILSSTNNEFVHNKYNLKHRKQSNEVVVSITECNQNSLLEQNNSNVLLDNQLKNEETFDCCECLASFIQTLFAVTHKKQN